MKHYYETVHHDEKEFPVITAHDTFEKAAEFAELHKIPHIHEVGGSWDEYEKCKFCGEWTPTQDLDSHGWCNHCSWYVEHGRG